MIKPGDLLPNTLAARATATPDRVLIRETSGRVHTYRQVHEHGRRWAAALRRTGVRSGDRVMTMTPTREMWLAAWLGVSEVGAVEAGINTDYSGSMLRYALALARPRLLLVTEEHLDKLTDEVLAGTAVERVIVLGGHAPNHPLAVPVHSSEEFLLDATIEGPFPPVAADDIACMTLTSGTTGASKYVLVPWGVLYSGATGPWPIEELTEDDCFYLPLPSYHGGGRYCLYMMALVGGSVLVRDRFSIEAFWSDIKEHHCTLTVMAWFAKMLWDRPARPDDADNPLRAVLLGPAPPFYREMATRFGFRTLSAYGMSEIGVPIRSGWDPPNHQTCGKPRKDDLGIEIRIVDDNGNDVPPGTSGEMIIRAAEPSALSPGYFEMPEASANAWRSGWFHTGDGFRADDDGYLYFVDRVKDAIRRRGENISSAEVEAIMNRHSAVHESAAVAAPSEGEEDEVLVFVVLQPGATSTYEELHAHMVDNAPRFMVPRYLELVTELPKTEATLRVRKVELRARGIGPNTWERSAARR